MTFASRVFKTLADRIKGRDLKPICKTLKTNLKGFGEFRLTI